MSRTRFRKLLPLVTTLALILPLLLALAAPVSAATLDVSKDDPACSDVTGDPYCTIQAAVDAANDGDVIDVYPGTYNESVDLGEMGSAYGPPSHGNLTLVTVNNAGIPAPGTVTVENPGNGSEFDTSGPFDGDLTIDGFNVHSIFPAIDVRVEGTGHDHNVEIRNVTATNVADDGIYVSADGNVTIADCNASNNQGPGIYVSRTGGDVTITNCTANQNVCPPEELGGIPAVCQAHGIAVVGVAGKVTITNCTTLGNGHGGIVVSPALDRLGEVAPSPALLPAKVTITKCTAENNEWDGISVFGTAGDVVITDCTANGNGEDGISVGRFFYPSPQVASAVGNVTITNCTANGNENGFHLLGIPGTATIQACIARDNRNDGVELEGLGVQGVGLVDGAVSVNGSIICGNGDQGLDLDDNVTVDARGNWWGCTGGPVAAGCDTVDEGPGTVDYTPWIDTISPSGPAAVMAGSSAVVTFQFSDSAKTVFLGEGPGDLHGDDLTFIVTTDNGTVTGGFINAPDGVLEVTLVPDHGGSATVWVDGPCGLDEQIVLGVRAAAAEFVPEPGSVVLLTSGLVGLAGYAGLRMRRK